jgi:hypothetical protein
MAKSLFIVVLCAGITPLLMARAQQPQQAPATVASTVDREVSTIEKLVVDAAEAMPEEKFNFSPESLSIAASEYKGVRTFAVQVKHIATSNWFIWSPLTGEKLPEGLNLNPEIK